MNHKIHMHWFLKVESLRETDAESLGTNSRSTIHKVYATSSEYPGKERTIVGKINVKVPHQRSPYAMRFEDRSHEETERQQWCARSKAWNLAKKYASSKKKRKLHSTSPRRNGCSLLRQQKSRRNESLEWIQERVCIWSVRQTLP